MNNITRFNKTNASTYRAGKVQVSVNNETGLISFSSVAIREIFGSKTKVEFIRNEDSKDWYILPTNSPEGLELRSDANKIGMVNCASVAKAINHDIEGVGASYLISQNPVDLGHEKMFLIIRSSRIVREKRKK